MRRVDVSKTIYFAVMFFFGILLLSFSFSRVFDGFEYSTLDFRYRARPQEPINENIVIIEIDNNSIEKLGKWPFLRNYHALLVKILKTMGAKTIVFDMIFSDTQKGDDEFAEAARSSEAVFLPYVFDFNKDNPDKTCLYAKEYGEGVIENLRNAAKGTGFINVIADIDGKIRAIPFFAKYKDVYYPHIAARVALNDMGYNFETAKIIPGKALVASGNFVIPLEKYSSLMINYPGVWKNTFRHYSYVDVIQSYLSAMTGQNPVMDLSKLKNAVCFVGVTAEPYLDAQASPLELAYPSAGIHASVYNGIIQKRFITRFNKWWNLFILILTWLSTIHITGKIKKRFAPLSVLFIMTGYLFVSVVFFNFWRIWIDVFYPLITIAVVYVVFTFKNYMTEIRAREIIEKELNIAKDIQQSFLPKELPKVGGIDVSVRMISAGQVGGDLYDVMQIGKNKLGVMIGDVSGKGVPAALYMARVVSLFKTFAKEETAVEVLEKLNKRLIGNPTNLFVTLTYMIFDAKENNTAFSIGGHLPTVLIEPDGNVELLDVAEGMPLGIMGGKYSYVKRDYKPGSIFVLYTDGVTEAMNTRMEMFGQERLIELAKELKACSAEEVVAAIHKEVLDFIGKAKQYDDTTVMAVRT